jgi:hypothetical protein
MRRRLHLAAVILGTALATPGLAACGAAGGSGATAAPVRATVTPPTQPSSAPAPSPSASWTSFTSARYGYSILVPPDWTLTPADHDWILDKDAAAALAGGADRFARPSEHTGIAATAWALDVDPDLHLVEWIESYCKLAGSRPCGGVRDQAIPVTVDGREGLLVPFDDDQQAFIHDGSRLHVVAVWRPDGSRSAREYGGARQLLKSLLSSMTFGDR